jgi:hypothetical protein
MIMPSEILADRIHEGYVVPQDVRDLVRTAPGITTQLYVNNILDSLGKNEPWLTGKLKRTNNPTIPTLDIVLALLDLKDDPESKKGKRRTAIEKFIDREGFADWKDKITSNEALGERGWDFVKSLWNRVVNDKMRADIVSERKKAMDEAPLDFGLFQLPNIPGSSFVARSMWPRVTEHIENTGDFTGKDAALDLLENGMMTVPGGSYMKLLGKIPGISRGTRAAGRAMQNMANSSPMGAFVAGGLDFAKNLAGNAVVPFTMEAVDDIAYDDGEGMDQRADFSIGDAAIGTGINQLVNRGLYKVLGPLITEGSGTVSARSPGVQKLREFLNGIGKGSGEPGAALARDARNAVNQNAVLDGMVPVSDIKSWRTGHMEAPRPQTEKELADNIAVTQLLDAIDNGKMTARDIENATRAGISSTEQRSKSVRKNLEKEAEKASEKHSDAILQEAELNKEIDGKDISTLSEQEQKRIHKARIRSHEAAKKDYDARKAIELHDMIKDNLAPALNNNRSVWASIDMGLGENKIPSAKLLEVLKENTPELVNYATWSAKGGPKATLGETIGNVMKVQVPTYLANKAGREKYTERVLNYMDPTGKLKKEQEDTHEAPLRRAQSSAASQILSTVPGVSAQGREFLEDLRKHPEWIKLGHPEKPSQFNLWLLTEGRDLLEDTPLYRPTWDVK